MQELLGTALLWPAQQIINSVLASDPHVQRSLARFAGKTIQLRISGTGIKACLIFAEDGIRLSAADAEKFALPVDATITASTSTLLELLLQGPDEQALVNPDMDIDGDVQLLQDLFTTLHRLDLDWQDYLGGLVGDLPAHELGKAVDASKEWGGQARARLHANVDDYLKEELQLFPHRQQIASFSDRLDQLKLRIDRASARSERLSRQLDKLD